MWYYCEFDDDNCDCKAKNIAAGVDALEEKERCYSKYSSLIGIANRADPLIVCIVIE
jgi:hypothetical protein